MNYEDLLKSHLRFGTTKEDIAKHKGLDEVLENVIISPWWGHEMFNNHNLKMNQINKKVFNYYGDNVSFSFIEIKNIGAPTVMDYILGLGVTKCKNILFIGSTGSLDENIKIGDIVVPEYSICGDGASRYLNKNLEDEFLKKEYPTKEMTDKLINLLEEKNIKYHYVPNFSVDNIFAQFIHIDKILELGSKTIEMETANLFKCGKIMNMDVTALFCVSDNTVLSKSLYSGRTKEEQEYRHIVRFEIIPKIIIAFFKSK